MTKLNGYAATLDVSGDSEASVRQSISEALKGADVQLISLKVVPLEGFGEDQFRVSLQARSLGLAPDDLFRLLEHRLEAVRGDQEFYLLPL